MLLLIDENVPDSVAAVFREHGRDVRLVRDLLGGATPDHVIAEVGDYLDAIVVTWNARGNATSGSWYGSPRPPSRLLPDPHPASAPWFPSQLFASRSSKPLHPH